MLTRTARRKSDRLVSWIGTAIYGVACLCNLALAIFSPGWLLGLGAAALAVMFGWWCGWSLCEAVSDPDDDGGDDF
jgi:hypothetical protein